MLAKQLFIKDFHRAETDLTNNQMTLFSQQEKLKDDIYINYHTIYTLDGNIVYRHESDFLDTIKSLLLTKFYKENPQSRAVFIADNGLQHYDNPEVPFEELVEADYGKINSRFLISMDEYPGFFYYSRPMYRYAHISGSLPVTTVDLCKPNKSLYQIASKFEYPCHRRNLSSLLEKHIDFRHCRSKTSNVYVLKEKMQDNLKPFFEKKQHYTYRVLGQRNPKGNLLFQMGFISPDQLPENEYDSIPKQIDDAFIDIINLSDFFSLDDLDALSSVFTSIQYNRSLNIQVNKQILLHKKFLHSLLNLDQDFVIDQAAYTHIIQNHQESGVLPKLSKTAYTFLTNNNFNSKLFNSILNEFTTPEEKMNFLILNILKIGMKKQYNQHDTEYMKSIIDFINSEFSNDSKDKYKNKYGLTDHEAYRKEMKEYYKKYPGLFRHLSNSYSRICDDLNIEDIDNLNGFTVLGNPELTYNHKLRHEKQKSKIIRIIGGKSQYMPTPITGKVSDETQIRIHEQYLQEAFAQGEYFENFEKTHYCHVFKTHSQGMSKDMVKLLNIVLEKDYYVVEEQPFDEKQFLSILETDLKYCTSIKKLMFVILNTMKLSTNKNNYQLLDAVHLFNIIKLIKHETYIQEMKEHYKKYTGLFVQLEHIYKDMEKLPQLKEFLDKKDISQRSIKELSPTYSAKPVKVDKKN